VGLDLSLVHGGTQSVGYRQTWLCWASKTLIAILASFPMTSNPLRLRLSHGLVHTSRWALPNCILVLNCPDSPKCFLRQKLQDEKRTASLELAKRPMHTIHQNWWHITRGTQSERRVLCLESRCYNKSCPGPMLSTSPRLDDQKIFLIGLKFLLDFLK
jgi:hypothetical protein